MKQAQFNEKQIIGVLRENEAGSEGGRAGLRARVSEGATYA